MAAARQFDRFVLDPVDRRLSEDGRTVDVSGRYLDALILLVAEQGRLVPKARFMQEVWKGVPVTDEALTQCIRALRRALGDEADNPRFIETVPRHGYRFIAPTRPLEDPVPDDRRAPVDRRSIPDARARALAGMVSTGRAGMIGGGIAGALGGLTYGFAGVANGPGGAVSGVLVLTLLTAMIGLAGGAGVGFGIGAAAFAPRRTGGWSVVGGALGGLVVGSVVRLTGLDAFTLLFGAAPTQMTGGMEGFVLGAATGAGAWLAQRRPRRVALLAGSGMGGLAGVGLALTGGRLMGGSLAALAEQFPAARLNLDAVGALFGETAFGPVSQTVTAGLEGALFGAAVVLALSLAARPSRRTLIAA